MGVAGRVFQTTGISALPLKDQSAIREKVETFDAFTPDNAPYRASRQCCFLGGRTKPRFQTVCSI
jgi:hypothetical protein